VGIELWLERKMVRGVLRVKVYRWIERGLAKPGKSAKGLAAALGCSESAVSRLRSETGRASPRIRWRALCTRRPSRFPGPFPRWECLGPLSPRLS